MTTFFGSADEDELQGLGRSALDDAWFPVSSASGSTESLWIQAEFSTGSVLAVRAVAWNDRAAMPGVTIGSDAAADASATTAADGSLVLGGSLDGALPLRVEAPLDLAAQAQADAAVTLRDALATLRMLSARAVGGGGHPAAAVWAADFDGSGAVSLADAVAIVRHTMNRPAPRPRWVFLDERVASQPLTLALEPGSVPGIAVDVAASGALGLVGVLRGDVDGSLGAGRFGLGPGLGSAYAVPKGFGDVGLTLGLGDLVFTAASGAVARVPVTDLGNLVLDGMTLHGSVQAFAAWPQTSQVQARGQGALNLRVAAPGDVPLLATALDPRVWSAGWAPALTVTVSVDPSQPDAAARRTAIDAALAQQAVAATQAAGAAVALVRSDGTWLLAAPWIDIAAASDTGSSNTDDISRMVSPTLEVRLPNVAGTLPAAGDVLTVQLAGQPWSSVTLSAADVAAQRVTLTLPALGADGLKVLRASLHAGGAQAAPGLPSNEIRYTLDATAPPPPTVDAVAGNDVLDAAERAALSGGSAVLVSGTATPGSTVQLQVAALGGSTPSLSTAVSTLVDAQGRWAFGAGQVSWPGGLAAPQAGAHEVRLAALDDLGNASSMVSRTFAVETVPTFGVVVEGSVVRFTGSANGTLFVNVNAAGTATFSRGVLGLSEVLSSTTTVTGLFSKSMADVQSLSVQVAASDSSTQHVFNAPSATSLVLRGSSGGGIDEIVIRIKDPRPGTYDTQALHVDTGSFTATGDTLTFRFEESARNVLTNPLDNDRLTLSPSTVIAEGFARLKVVAGMVDVSQISPSQGGYLPPNKDWEIGSGVVMSLEQLQATRSVVSPTGTGGLIVEITPDRQNDLAEWLSDEAAMIELWGVTAGVSIDGLIGPLLLP